MQRSASVNLTKTVDMLNTNSCWLWHLASFKLLLNSSGCVAASLKCSTFENPICMKNMDFGRFSSKAVILIIAAESGLLFFSCALKCIYFTSFETCYFFLWSHKLCLFGEEKEKPTFVQYYKCNYIHNHHTQCYCLQSALMVLEPWCMTGWEKCPLH